MRNEPPSTGLTRRRRRLSDTETAQRMLGAAVEMVNRTGLTVSLEHLSLEDVIREAEVSRSAVYRRWPYKELFFSDLLIEIADAAAPSALPGRTGSLEPIRRAVSAHLDWLATPAGRRALLVELVRVERDFETIRDSTEWRTYLALHATFLSLPDGELRERVRTALARSEQGFLDRIGTAWEHLSELLGLRLRPELGVTFHTVASMVSATLRGFVLMAPTTPDIVTWRAHADPFGVGPAEWSQQGLALASVAVTVLEPDPDVVWDDERLARVRRFVAD